MENIDYKHLYLKYKKKYLNLKNQIGGTESKSRSRSRRSRNRNRNRNRNRRRGKGKNVPNTATSKIVYTNFFNDVSRVLYCIISKFKKEHNINLKINVKNSGMYLNINNNLYLSIHQTINMEENKGRTVSHRFHIKQDDNQYDLAIQYSGNKLKIIGKEDDIWNYIDPKMDSLIKIIQNCVNTDKLNLIELQMKVKQLTKKNKSLKLKLDELDDCITIE